jgi:DNA primase
MPRISEETIERVSAATDIVEVIGSYFPLKRAGTSFRALCPFHREKSPSFHVSPQKQAYYCFGCGAGGSVFKFVMEYERVDFATAVQRLAQRAGVTIVEADDTPGEGRRREQRRRLLDLHRLAAEWFAHQLLRTPGGAAARDYLKSRELTAEVAKNWQLGYAPDSRDALLRHARDAGFHDDDLRACGLFVGGDHGPLSSRFRHRLMFPICNDYGEVIAFSGRVLPPSEDPAKYVNSPETPLFTKGRALFGLHKARRPLADSATAIVCEGQLDLIRIAESGLGNVVAPQGTAFTAPQARLLRRYAETAILCFDSDRAGRTAVERSLPILLAAGFGVRVAALPPGEDPDSLIRRRGADAFREVVEAAPDYFDFAVTEAAGSGVLDDASAKAGLVRKLAGFAASLPDSVARESVAARLGPRLAVSARAFLDAIPRRAPAAEVPDEEPPAEPQAGPPDPAVQLLLHAALFNLDARRKLSELRTADVLGPRPGMDLLRACAKADFDPADPAAARRFLESLPASDQPLVARLLIGRPPGDPVRMVHETTLRTRIEQLEARREELTARLRQPGMAADEVQRLQVEVIDITRELQEINRLVLTAGQH